MAEVKPMSRAGLLAGSAGGLSTQARQEAQKQWEANPCGASTVQGKQAESLEWFREARRVRYHEYAPWLRAATGIDAIRSADVLEIGVGLGSDHLTLARGGNRMTALDLSREHLRLTQRHLKLEGYTTNAMHGDMEQMPFPDSSFDVVYSFGVLHHTDHMDRAVAEIRRVLRPRGRAIIGVYHRNSLFFIAGVLLYRGIIRGGLFKQTWRKTLAAIEIGAGGEFVPTVQVLTRHSFRDLLSAVGPVKLSVHHISNRLLIRLFGRDRSERMFGQLGWYIIATCQRSE